MPQNDTASDEALAGLSANVAAPASAAQPATQEASGDTRTQVTGGFVGPISQISRLGGFQHSLCLAPGASPAKEWLPPSGSIAPGWKASVHAPDFDAPSAKAQGMRWGFLARASRQTTFRVLLEAPARELRSDALDFFVEGWGFHME